MFSVKSKLNILTDKIFQVPLLRDEFETRTFVPE